MKLGRILFVLLVISFVAATVVSALLNVVIQGQNGISEEGELDVVGSLSIAMRLLAMAAISAPPVFLNCSRWVRESALLRFLAFVLLPLLIVIWVSLFSRERPDWDILLMQSAVFLATQWAAYLWFTSVVRGNG